MIYFLILYCGFCMGAAFISVINTNEEIEMGIEIGEKIEICEIIIRTITAPIIVPIVLYLYIRDKYWY